MDIAIVGDRYVTALFRLVGVEAVEVKDVDSAVAKVKQLVEEDYKVLLITEETALRLAAFRETLVEMRIAYPVFLIIPDFEKIIGLRKSELTNLVNRSVGVKLKTGD